MRVSLIDFQVLSRCTRTVLLNRWQKLCPSCFDTEAEKAGVRYSFTGLAGMSWSDRLPPRNLYKRRR
jgi:hypothetical protein